MTELHLKEQLWKAVKYLLIHLKGMSAVAFLAAKPTSVVEEDMGQETDCIVH